jgi:hypothetical protein
VHHDPLVFTAGDPARLSAHRAVAEGFAVMPFASVDASAHILTNAALDLVCKIPEFKYATRRIKADTVR